MRSLLRCLLIYALLCSAGAVAQQFAPAVRIVDRIDEGNLVTLKGNTHPYANARNDQGRVTPDLAMTDLILVLSRDPAQQAAFEKFVASQYDSTSPSFHEWLAPEEVGALFGPSETDIATVSNWLTGHGFIVNETSKDRMAIRFSGTAGQVESAFHAEIHNLTVKGVAHIGNMSDPQIPAALAHVVVGVRALHNFFPRPLHRMGSQVQRDSGTGKWVRLVGAQSSLSFGGMAAGSAEAMAKPRPQFGSTGTYDGYSYLVEDVSPYDFATIYNVLPLWSAGIDGSGQTIAIAGTSNINYKGSNSDIALFRSNFDLPANTPTVIVANGTDPGLCTSTISTASCTIDDLIENTLDVEWAGAVAKGAKIVLVTSGVNSTTTDALYASEQYIVNNKTASIMNVSYGECELGLGTAGNVSYYNLWNAAAAEGIAVFVATGDSGSAACDQGGDSSGVPYEAKYGLSVNGMASTPFNTAVGGTDFNWCSPSSSTECTASPYWNATNNATTKASAMGYVPEIPWNDTCASLLGVNYLEYYFSQIGGVANQETACNALITYASEIQAQGDGSLLYMVDTVGGGGGMSSCVVNSSTNTTSGSCSSGATTTGSGNGSLLLVTDGWPKPGWQTGVSGIPADGVRDIPDVSFFASDGFLSYSAYLFCVQEGGYSCSYSDKTAPLAQEVGGTSVATPAMAGVMALINQQSGATQGSPNQQLYQLAAQQTYSQCSAESVTTSSACFFNDIDSGTNAVPCASGSPDCTVLYPGDTVGILSGYSAAQGYDQVTGLGSLNVANLVNAWLSDTGTAAASVTVNLSSSTIPVNQGLTVSGTVASASSGSTTTPTGHVRVMIGSYWALQALSSGNYSFTIPAESLPVGNDTVTVFYSGDSIYYSEKGTSTVDVTALTPKIALTSSAATAPINTPPTITVNVTGQGPTPMGTVTLTSGSYTSWAQNLSGGSFTFPVNSYSYQTYLLNIGDNIFTLTYSGDSNYSSGTSSTTVNLQQVTPTLNLDLNSTTYLNYPLSINDSFTIPNGGPWPTGTITFSSGNFNSQPQTLYSGETVFYSVPAGALPLGGDTITASYSGDAYNSPASATAKVTVLAAAPTITITPPPFQSSIAAAQTIGVVITGSLTTAPTGTLTLTINNGNYTATQSVGNGTVSFAIPPLSFGGGDNQITVTYSGDANYAAFTQIAMVWMTGLSSSMTVNPASVSIDTDQGFSITVTVSDPSGMSTPSGTVQMIGDSTEIEQQLANGSTTFTFPQNSFGVGNFTISFFYLGSYTYGASSSIVNVAVAQSTYSLSNGGNISIQKGATTGNAVTITPASSTDYTGTLTLTCAVAKSTASYPPTCSISPSAIPFSSGTPSGNATATITTTAATTGLNRPPIGSPGRMWMGAGGGAVLACVVLLWVPAQRRKWLTMLCLLVLLAVLGTISACGGGGAGGSGGAGGAGGGGGSSGTTSGAYTVTVTAVGNDSAATTASTTFTVTVN
jgi:hypothetical protein